MILYYVYCFVSGAVYATLRNGKPGFWAGAVALVGFNMLSALGLAAWLS